MNPGEIPPEVDDRNSGAVLAICRNCKYWRRGGFFDRVKIESAGEKDVEIVLRNPPSRRWEPHHIAIITDQKQKHGLCMHPAMGSGYIDGWLNRENAGKRLDGVYADNDEGRASLVIGESFGCIHFSANPQDDSTRPVNPESTTSREHE